MWVREYVGVLPGLAGVFSLAVDCERTVESSTKRVE